MLNEQALLASAISTTPNSAKYLYRGVSSNDLGDTYYDERYGLTFNKWSNGISSLYRVAQGSVVNGALINGGTITDTGPFITTEDRTLTRFIVPGGTLLHNNKIDFELAYTSSATLNGTFYISITDNLNNPTLYKYTRGVNALTSQNLAFSLTAHGVNTLILTSSNFIYSESGSSARMLNLLSDFTVNIYYVFNGGATGKTVSNLVTSGRPKMTYTTVQNTVPSLSLSEYRDPRVTPFSNDSFWNVHLPATTTYANPLTDLITKQIRDEYAGLKVKSGSKTNIFWIQGNYGDGVPFTQITSADPVCDTDVVPSTSGIRICTPFMYKPYSVVGNINTGRVSYRMRLPQNNLRTGQNSDRFVVVVSEDKRFSFELGQYQYTSRAWEPNNKYYRADTVVPTDVTKRGKKYTIQANGTSGNIEPDWGITNGEHTADASLSWKCEDGYITSNRHTSVTAYTVDLYGLGFSAKYYPWTSNTITNANLIGYDFQQFHRAGGLPMQGGLVRKEELDSGYIPHVIAISIGAVLLKAVKFSVVSATGNTFVVKPISSRFTEMDYTSVFTSGEKVVHSAGNSATTPVYTCSGTPTWNATTNETTFNVVETIDSNASFVWLGIDKGFGRYFQACQFPNIMVDGDVESSYVGLAKLGEMFAIPKGVDITTLGLTAEGLMLARAFQDFGGITVDRTGDTLAICQVDSSVEQIRIANLSTDKTAIINQLVRVTNFNKSLVLDGIAEGLLPYQKPIIPMY